MKIPILDLKLQYQQIKEEIQTAINKVLESGQFILGPEVKQFEQEVATYLGAKYAIGVNSGTDALTIGLKALGINEGDEIITTPFSFFATAESISNIGAKPVFADINPITFNIEPEQIRAKITPKTKAIIPVHLYGRPAAMTQIMEIAAEYSLKVIEDCAQSFGARYLDRCKECQAQCDENKYNTIKGKFTGNIGDVGAYSFFPTKNLGAYGDAGLIITNNPEIAETARMLRIHGAKKKYHNEVLGYNSRLDTIQAAILLVKLKYVETWNKERVRVAKLYNQLLANIPNIITPQLIDGHVFHQYTIRLLNVNRDKVAEELDLKGISTMIYYPVPQDRLPVYKGQYPVYPVSDLLSTQVLSLPIWPELENNTIELIAETLKKIVISSK